MTGNALVPTGGREFGRSKTPTSRDQVIRSDLARGVDAAQLAEEWDLALEVISYIAGTLRPDSAGEPQAYERLIARLSGDDDPDERRHPRALAHQASGYSPETKRKLRYYAGLYLDYCAGTGRREVPGNRFTVEAFTIWLAERPVSRGKNKGLIGLAPSSIGVALSAVAALHRACGENPPDRDLARGILKNHKAKRARDRAFTDGQGPDPVDLPTFAQIVGACDPTTNAGVRDRAMLTMGLNFMARRSELCSLNLGDIVVESDEWLSVFIAHTKTGKARTVKVPAWPDPELDPHRAWRAHQERLTALGLVDGPAFRAVDRWDNVQGVGQWAGRAEMGSRLDGATLEHIIMRAALKAAIPTADELTPHGVLRHTGATLAYKAGADILSIARQGGWAENSPVVFRYIGDVDQYKRNPMLLVGHEGGA